MYSDCTTGMDSDADAARFLLWYGGLKILGVIYPNRCVSDMPVTEKKFFRHNYSNNKKR